MMNTRTVCYCNYSIGGQAYENVAQVCGIYGRRALLIGGKKALDAGEQRLRVQLEGSSLQIVETVLYGHDITVFQLLGGTTGDKGFNLFFFHIMLLLSAILYLLQQITICMTKFQFYLGLFPHS